MAAKPACVREYPSLNFSLTNSFFSVKIASGISFCLRLGPEKHNILSGFMRNCRKVRNTRCSDVDNKILSRMQLHVAFCEQGHRHFPGQLSPAEGVSGTANSRPEIAQTRPSEDSYPLLGHECPILLELGHGTGRFGPNRCARHHPKKWTGSEHVTPPSGQLDVFGPWPFWSTSFGE